MWATCEECGQHGNVQVLVSRDLTGQERNHGALCRPCRDQIRMVMRLSGHSDIRVVPS